MFSGIVEPGSVRSARLVNGNLRVSITAPAKWRLRKGESVSVNGVCSTVIALHKNSIDFDYMPETLKRSTIARLQPGNRVNLERSLEIGDRLHGHFVQGHVDAVGTVATVSHHDGVRITIDVPKGVMKFIAPKGSIALEGVSLTITHRTARSFSVALIPHTCRTTTLGTLRPGERVNVETDMLARQLATLVSA